MRVNVVTPWYPDRTSVYLGVFVAQQVEALRRRGIEVDVEVPHLYPAPPGPIPAEVVDAMRCLADRDPGLIYPQEAGTTWIPAPVPSRSGYAGRATAFAAAIAEKRRVMPVDADVTHAHLGVPTGAALLDGDAPPLVVTEHQSTLDLVLREPAARAMYLDVIRAAAAFFVVSQHLADRLQEEFGDVVADKVGVMPNIVDLSDLPFVERAEFDCSSWIYVGALTSHKGGQLLVKSFVEYRRDYAANATLTVIGGGDLSDWAIKYCRAHGAGEALRLMGAVEHARLGGFFADADLMVHLSSAETFGIASLEAIGSGLPVVSLRNGGAEHNWGGIEPIAGSILDRSSSPTDVAAAVDGLRRNPARLELSRARRFIERSFGPDAVASRLEAVYREVVER